MFNRLESTAMVATVNNEPNRINPALALIKGGWYRAGMCRIHTPLTAGES